MKAFRISQSGDGASPGFVDVGVDDLDPGEVVVRVAYSGINYKDALAATGKGRILRRPSCIGGIDLAGTVMSSSDSRFAPGDAVLAAGHALGVSHDGGYAEQARVPADWLLKLPPGLSLWEAMALGTAGLTAALAIIRMEQNGLTPAAGRVVVSGATGGVGSIAIAALARAGYEAVALTGKTGRPDKVGPTDVGRALPAPKLPEGSGSPEEYLRAIGASEVIARSSIDLEHIKALGPATWAGGIDNVGGPVLAWMASTAKPNGVIASIGLAMSAEVTMSVMPLILRGVSILGINSSDSPTAALREQAWRRLATDLKPARLEDIAMTIPFEELPSAFERLMNGSVRGRTVVRIGGEPIAARR